MKRRDFVVSAPAALLVAALPATSVAAALAPDLLSLAAWAFSEHTVVPSTSEYALGVGEEMVKLLDQMSRLVRGVDVAEILEDNGMDGPNYAGFTHREIASGLLFDRMDETPIASRVLDRLASEEFVSGEPLMAACSTAGDSDEDFGYDIGVASRGGLTLIAYDGGAEPQVLLDGELLW